MAKIVKEAIDRMVRAIEEYDITGIQTTLGFGKFVMQHEAFTSGKFDTHFVSKYFNAGSLKNDLEDEAFIAALAAVMAFKNKPALQERIAPSAEQQQSVAKKQNTILTHYNKILKLYICLQVS